MDTVLQERSQVLEVEAIAHPFEQQQHHVLKTMQNINAESTLSLDCVQCDANMELSVPVLLSDDALGRVCVCESCGHAQWLAPKLAEAVRLYLQKQGLMDRDSQGIQAIPQTALMALLLEAMR